MATTSSAHVGGARKVLLVDVAVAVFIEESDVERNDIAGGRLAGPVAKAVIEALR